MQGKTLAAADIQCQDNQRLHQQLAELSGRFAVMIFNRVSGQLQAYSDKFGALALFYHDDADEYRIGTQLSDIRLQQHYAGQGLYNYFYFHTIPGPDTVWQDVFKLEPASYVSLMLDSPPFTAVYWQPQFAHKLASTKSELASGLRQALMHATASYCDRSEVGCFLSGGLDSSSVVACLAKQSKQPVKTFTIGFAEPGYDETAYAKIVADAFNTEH
ncbi:asparagine synthase-related protein, partial [Arsukibacterium sp.]|uniref:asparagine synthase-related protein n=1 Tax=Arsukibacterium sp. TaxID=1977258 RepID=UPI002FDB32EF